MKVYIVVEQVFTHIDLDSTFIPEIRGVFAAKEGADNLVYQLTTKIAPARFGLSEVFRSERGYVEVEIHDVLGRDA